MNVKQTNEKNVRKWKLFFIVLAKKWRQEKKMLQKYCHFFICSKCVFTTAARRINKFIFNTITNWSSPAEILLQCPSITILRVFANWHRRTEHA